jgi:hypothetical protein
MRIFLNILILLLPLFLSGQDVKYNDPGAGNPLLPGYFADPTVTKFGDTFYIYATTDGIKNGGGESQVWLSNDFVNWYNYRINVPRPNFVTYSWAPDCQKGANGKYYYYYGNCQSGCNIYGNVSDSPMGPFTALNNGKPVIPSGTIKDGFPALDAQLFIDDDGSVYSYFGTWCSSWGGIGVAKIDPTDMITMTKTFQIPLTQVPKAFEASYMFKRNGKYFLMYSVGDCNLSSYSVYYSVGDSPEGPFKAGVNSPILVTSTDDLVDGPGHHSVIKEGNDYYIVYHRHDNPHSIGGEFRQVCADKLNFTADETIQKVVPTHLGIGPLGTNQISAKNLAYQAKASASSYYHLVTNKTVFSIKPIDYRYLPEYATDDNNGTMWRANGNELPQSLVVDLGKSVDIKRVMTQFEYTTFYYQYKIEVSTDSTNWSLYSDKTKNRRCGSPMIDDNSMTGRYVKLTVTGTEKSGLLAAVWNIKVYDTLFEIPSFQNSESAIVPGTPPTKNLLVNFQTESLDYGNKLTSVPNTGTLGGTFGKVETPVVAWVDSVKSVLFDGKSYLKLSVKSPSSLIWNSSYTASAWVYNPTVELHECLVVWDTRDNMSVCSYVSMMYGTSGYGASAHGASSVDMGYRIVPAKAKWHHILLTFDGMQESIYVDGKVNNQIPMSLYTGSGNILIGGSTEGGEFFTGYIANAQLYDKATTPEEVVEIMNATKPKNVVSPGGTASSELLKKTENLFQVSNIPGSNTIWISSTEDVSGKTIELISLDGRVVSSGKFNGSSTIELPFKIKGVYIVVMNNNNSKYTQKVAVY